MASRDNCRHEVGEVALADEFRAQFYAFSTAYHSKAGGICIVANILDMVVCTGIGYRIAFHGDVFDRPIGYIGEVVVDNGQSRTGQSVDQLEFGTLYIPDRFERFEMLFTHGGDNAYLRCDEIAYFFDITDLFSPHFTDENVVVGLHLFPYGADYSHRRIKTAGSH